MADPKPVLRVPRVTLEFEFPDGTIKVSGDVQWFTGANGEQVSELQLYVDRNCREAAARAKRKVQSPASYVSTGSI